MGYFSFCASRGLLSDNSDDIEKPSYCRLVNYCLTLLAVTEIPLAVSDVIPLNRSSTNIISVQMSDFSDTDDEHNGLF
jgi:hypothetical protein